MLCDPDTEQPFYIGKGSGNRAMQHMQLCRYKYECNKQKKQIIRSILDQGKKVLIRKVAEFAQERDAYTYERELIQQYRGVVVNIRGFGPAPKQKTKVVKTETIILPPGKPVESIIQNGQEYVFSFAACKSLGVTSHALTKHAQERGIQRYKRGLRNQVFYRREDIEALKDWLFRIRPAEGK